MTKAKANNVADAAAIPGSALVRLVRESGLETQKADLLIAKFNGFQAIAEEYEATARTIQVTDASQTDLMARARKGRLYLKDMRVEIEKTRVALKDESLKEGKAIDSVAKALKSLIEPTEEYLRQQERFVETQEENRIKAIVDARNKELASLDIDGSLYNFTNMSDAAFRELINITILARKAQAEQAQRDTEERERIKAENARLRAEADAREAERKKEREEAAQKQREADMKIRAEQDRAAQLQREADAKAKAERDAETARVKSEKKAAAAPDKTKLILFAAMLENLELPVVTDESAQDLQWEIKKLLEKVVTYIRTNAENL